MKILLISGVCYMGAVAQKIELLFMLNAALPANFFQIILPNYMIIKLEQEIRFTELYQQSK
jgi:hypothetical protein